MTVAVEHTFMRLSECSSNLSLSPCSRSQLVSLIICNGTCDHRGAKGE
jgi:phage terminase small subunit